MVKFLLLLETYLWHSVWFCVKSDGRGLCSVVLQDLPVLCGDDPAINLTSIYNAGIFPSEEALHHSRLIKNWSSQRHYLVAMYENSETVVSWNKFSLPSLFLKGCKHTFAAGNLISKIKKRRGEKIKLSNLRRKNKRKKKEVCLQMSNYKLHHKATVQTTRQEN